MKTSNLTFMKCFASAGHAEAVLACAFPIKTTTKKTTKTV